MTKVHLVISKYLPEYTGAAYRLDNFYRRQPDIVLKVLCNSTSEKKSAAYTHDSVKVRRIVFPWQWASLPPRIATAAKVYYEAALGFYYLWREKPEFLHIAGYSGGTMAALVYGRLFDVPRLIELVTSEATPYQYLPGLRYPRFLRLERKTAIVAISQNIADGCKKRGLQKNIWCRPNPIDETRFLPEPAEKMRYRQSLSPFREQDIVIAMVAKFMPQKNQIFMLDVMRFLPEEYKLLLAGPRAQTGMFKDRDGQYFADILDRVERYGLQNRVHIEAGFVDAASYMKAADIYVMPQHTEGLGTPMLEAMACGVPVVANRDEAAFTEWVKNGENGYLSEMNPEIWAQNIQKAQGIPLPNLERASHDIREIASTAKSDERYCRLMAALRCAATGREFEIKDVI